MRYDWAIGLLAGILLLSGCGARGDLELPPRAVSAQTPDGAEPARPDNSFILDPLL